MLRQDQLVQALEQMMTDDQIEFFADTLYAHAQDSVCGEIDPDTDEPYGLNFRFYLRPDGALSLCIGLNDYDTDHRGFCVSGWIPHDASLDDVIMIVSDTLQELFDEVCYPEFG